MLFKTALRDDLSRVSRVYFVENTFPCMGIVYGYNVFKVILFGWSSRDWSVRLLNLDIKCRTR